MASYISVMVTKGDLAIVIEKLYHYFGSEPFTYKKVVEKLPEFKVPMITAMHYSNVIRLLNRKKKVNNITKKNPSTWVFTTEALFLLQKYYGDDHGS